MSIGEALAAAREQRGLTLQQVSDVTRIRASVISAMEHDDFSGAAGDVYARGHIRSIARAVGADSEALVAQFDAEHEVETAPSATEVFESETRSRRERRGPNWSAAMAAALVAAIGVLAFQLVTRGGQDTPTPGATQAGPTPSASVPTVTSSPSTGSPTGTPSSSDTAIAQVPNNGVSLRMSIVGTASWVQVSDASGAVLFSGTLTNGQTKDFRNSQSLSVVIGNASAVDLVVNGQDLGTAGGDGEVVRHTFRPGDPSGSAG